MLFIIGFPDAFGKKDDHIGIFFYFMFGSSFVRAVYSVWHLNMFVSVAFVVIFLKRLVVTENRNKVVTEIDSNTSMHND